MHNVDAKQMESSQRSSPSPKDSVLPCISRQSSGSWNASNEWLLSLFNYLFIHHYTTWNKSQAALPLSLSSYSLNLTTSEVPMRRLKESAHAELPVEIFFPSRVMLTYPFWEDAIQVWRSTTVLSTLSPTKPHHWPPWVPPVSWLTRAGQNAVISTTEVAL